jgi:hypothetical protein
MREPTLERQKDRIIDKLTDLYSKDGIGMDSFESLVSQVNAVESETALNALVLSRSELQAIAPQAQEARTLPANDEITVSMSNVRKEGRWLISDHVSVKGHMGTIILDLRDYAFEQDFKLFLRLELGMSTVKLIVPPNFAVTERFEHNSMSTVKNRNRRAGPITGAILIGGNLNMSTVKVKYRR